MWTAILAGGDVIANGDYSKSPHRLLLALREVFKGWRIMNDPCFEDNYPTAECLENQSEYGFEYMY